MVCGPSSLVLSLIMFAVYGEIIKGLSRSELPSLRYIFKRNSYYYVSNTMLLVLGCVRTSNKRRRYKAGGKEKQGDRGFIRKFYTYIVLL